MYWDKNGKGYYFDPQGKGPSPDWIGLMQTNSKGGNWTIVAHSVQSRLSKKCGLHVAYFLFKIHNMNPPVHISGVTNLLKGVNDENVLMLARKMINKHV